jgi:hypothetical protein
MAVPPIWLPSIVEVVESTVVTTLKIVTGSLVAAEGWLVN